MRIARNTLFLYFRMFLLMAIGLFTSRIVLKNLGVEDYGTYNAVAGLVSLFSIFTNSIGHAITRFITCETGHGNKESLKDIFAASMAIQLVFCAVIFLIAETLGLWFLNSRMEIPEGRMDAANWVLQCTTAMLMLNLLSVPFNSVIMAHEQMKAYSFISILEASLKLGAALYLMISGFDKLKTYAVLMLISAAIVRITYSSYSRRHFEEAGTAPAFKKGIIRQIAGFAGWNALSSGVFLINTQGLNVLTNLFFGVAANAARGVAAQVESLVKQFVNNVLVAINPQITKSYSSGNRDYSYTLVSKGAKYAFLIMVFFIAPTLFEAQTILELWLGTVPEQAALFTKLTFICAALDLLMSPISTIILADGKIKGFYTAICILTATIFPVSWFAFKAGFPAQSAYLVFISVYVVLDVMKLVLVHRLTGFPYGLFLKEVVAKTAVPAMLTLSACYLGTKLLPQPTILRMFVTVLISSVVLAVSSYFFAMTDGERGFIRNKLHIS